MSTILVTYYSRSGNTEAVARAIHEVLTGAEIRPFPPAGRLDGYDLVFVGFPVQRHSLPYPVELFLRQVPAGKAIALFSTHGSLQGHQLSREAIEYAVVLASQARVLGTFHCRGRLAEETRVVLAKSPEHLEWTEMAASAASHPDAADIEEARAFAHRMEILAAQGGY
jgi:flavodoxin